MTFLLGGTEVEYLEQAGLVEGTLLNKTRAWATFDLG